MQKIGHEEIVLVHKKQVSSCIRGGLDWLSGTTSSLKVFLGIGIGCPRKQWNLYLWRNVRMRCLGTWFRSGLTRAKLIIGLDNLKGLFQPKWSRNFP